MPLTRAKRLHGGHMTTASKVRHRAGVHGKLPRYPRPTTLDFTRQFLPGVWLANR